MAALMADLNVTANTLFTKVSSSNTAISNTTISSSNRSSRRLAEHYTDSNSVQPYIESGFVHLPSSSNSSSSIVNTSHLPEHYTNANSMLGSEHWRYKDYEILWNSSDRYKYDSHENVLGEGKYSQIFEYIDAVNFKKWIRQVEDGDVRHYLYQMLKGVDVIHSHGILHRDLKPENIAIEERQPAEPRQLQL